MSRAGWKTFTSTKLHVALEYPPDWTASENAIGITFTGPQGAEILLSPVNTGGLSPESYLAQNSDLANTRCTTNTNPDGITARVCFDTIAFSYSADIIAKAAGSPSELLALSTSARKGEDANVFYAMLASIKPVP